MFTPPFEFDPSKSDVVESPLNKRTDSVSRGRAEADQLPSGVVNRERVAILMGLVAFWIAAASLAIHLIR